jgi:hypothetical protein
MIPFAEFSLVLERYKQRKAAEAAAAPPPAAPKPGGAKNAQSQIRDNEPRR